MKVKDIVNEVNWRRLGNFGVKAVDRVFGGNTKGFADRTATSPSQFKTPGSPDRHMTAKFVSLADGKTERHYFSFEGNINAFYRYDIVPASEPTQFIKGSKVAEKDIYQAIRREGPTPIHIADISKRGDMSRIAVTDKTI